MSVRSAIAVLSTLGLLIPFSMISMICYLPSASAQYPWNIETLALGQSCSVAVDSSGRIHALFDNLTGVLTYGLKDGGSWSFQDIDVNTACGAIALARNGSPSIAYFRVTDHTVRYAYRVGSSFVNEIIDQINGTAASMISLAVDSNGRSHVTHWNRQSAPGAYLMYAHQNESGWIVETVLYASGVSSSNEGPSIALDSTGSPRIASTPDGPWGGLVYSKWNGSGWSNSLVDVWFNRQCCSAPSLKLDFRDNPHVAYFNVSGQNLRYARFNEMVGGWAFENLYTQAGGSGIGSARVSLALDAQDRPRITYLDTDSVQLLYFYSDAGGWHQEIPDSTTPAGFWNSLALDSLGAPHVLYTVLLANNTPLVKHAWQDWPDTVPPSSSVDPIRPYWHSSQPMQVSATAADPGQGVANVTLWYRESSDNVTWGGWMKHSTLDSPPWVWPFPFPAGEGYYEFYSTAIDVVGNAEAPPPMDDAIAGYDVTPPVSSVLHISPYWQTTPSLTVTATAIDNLSGVANVTLLYSHAPLSNASWSPWMPFGTKTSPPWSWSFPFPGGEGNYKFHTIAGDLAGNIEGTKDYAEAVAGYRIPPDYLPINPFPSSPTTVGLSLPVQLSIEILNSGGFENVNTTLAFHNESSHSSPFFTTEVAPIPTGSTSGPFVATWTSPATPCACHVVANVDYYDNVTESNETNNTYTWTVNVVAGPMTYLSIGNPNYTSAVTYVKSTTPFNFLILDQSGLGIRNTTYTIDGGAPVNYTAAGTFFLTGEGEHTVNWRSLDWAGNSEELNSRVLRVDDVPPATTLSIGDPKYLLGGNFVTSSTSLTLLAVDGGVTPVGLDYTEYRIDSGSWKTYSSLFPLAGEGAHILEYRSRDLLGNSEAVQSMQMVVDDTPPVTAISIGEPKYWAGGDFVKSSTPLTLSAVDIGVGPNSTFYRLWDDSWTQWREYSSSFSLAGMDGTWFVEFLSLDYLGNMEVVQNETLILDDTPPVTTISPAAPFTLASTDSGCGVNATMYRIDGGSWTVYAGGFSLPEGEHTIFYYSIDKLGNVEQERSLVVRPSVEVEVNYKPIVALLFAIVLAVVGLWASKKRPWKGGKDRTAMAKVFLFTSMPFVMAEMVTGVVSFLTGQLSIPPLIGYGTAVDLAILIAGISVAVLRALEPKKPRAEETESSRIR